MTTTIRVSKETRDRLAAVAASTGTPMTRVLDEAVDALERRVFFDCLNRPYGALGQDGGAGGVPVTSAWRRLPSHIEIDNPDSGLDQVSYAKCEDLKSVSDRRLMHRLGVVETGVMAEIERVLRSLLD